MKLKERKRAAITQKNNRKLCARARSTDRIESNRIELNRIEMIEKYNYKDDNDACHTQKNASKNCNLYVSARDARRKS